MVDQRVVFQVCDQPHPTIARAIIDSCGKGNLYEAIDKLNELWNSGYAASDIIGTIFKVTKSHDGLPEGEKLEYLREIGFTHMKISNGISTRLQLLGLLARLSRMKEA